MEGSNNPARCAHMKQWSSFVWALGVVCDQPCLFFFARSARVNGIMLRGAGLLCGPVFPLGIDLFPARETKNVRI